MTGAGYHTVIWGTNEAHDRRMLPEESKKTFKRQDQLIQLAHFPIQEHILISSDLNKTLHAIVIIIEKGHRFGFVLVLVLVLVLEWLWSEHCFNLESIWFQF